MKQVQRKKALESKNDEQPNFANVIRADSSPQQLMLKQRKMTEDDRKVRFMVDEIETKKEDYDESPFK